MFASLRLFKSKTSIWALCPSNSIGLVNIKLSNKDISRTGSFVSNPDLLGRIHLISYVFRNDPFPHIYHVHCEPLHTKCWEILVSSRHRVNDRYWTVPILQHPAIRPPHRCNSKIFCHNGIPRQLEAGTIR
jgi:hypothetical protein